MTTVPMYLVDAFTDVPFAGNPAGVCLLDGPAPDAWMAAVAAEVNVSETAFTWVEGGVRRLRWYTPTVEVSLCGHATLATAHILWSEGITTDRVLTFATASGDLQAAAAGVRIRLDLPVVARSAADPALVSAASAALGPVDVVGAARFGINLLVEVDGPVALRSLRPDPAAVLALGSVSGGAGLQGVIATSAGDGFDYLVRYFAPAAGIDEDPVTGSAQCAAAPWWAERTGRRAFAVLQASPRTGRLWVDLDGDRVGVAGHATTVMRGSLAPAPSAVGA